MFKINIGFDITHREGLSLQRFTHRLQTLDLILSHHPLFSLEVGSSSLPPFPFSLYSSSFPPISSALSSNLPLPSSQLFVVLNSLHKAIHLLHCLSNDKIQHYVTRRHWIGMRNILPYYGFGVIPTHFERILSLILGGFGVIPTHSEWILSLILGMMLILLLC